MRAGAILRPLLNAGGDNFRDTRVDTAVFTVSQKSSLYLAFRRGEVAERLKAAVC